MCGGRNRKWSYRVLGGVSCFGGVSKTGKNSWDCLANRLLSRKWTDSLRIWWQWVVEWLQREKAKQGQMEDKQAWNNNIMNQDGLISTCKISRMCFQFVTSFHSYFFFKKMEFNVCISKSPMFSEISYSLRKSYSYSPRIPQNSISTSVSAHSMKQLIIYVLVPWIRLLTSHGLRKLYFILHRASMAEFGK